MTNPPQSTDESSSPADRAVPTFRRLWVGAAALLTLMVPVGFENTASHHLMWGAGVSSAGQPTSWDGTRNRSPDPGRLTVRWTVLTNRLEGENRSRQRLRLTNQGEDTFPARRWTLYFNFLRNIDPETVSPSVRITRINGSFYKLEPASGFEPLAPGASRTVRFETRGPALKVSDAPAGFYAVYRDSAGRAGDPTSLGATAVGPFPPPPRDYRSPTPATRYRRNQELLSAQPEEVGRVTPKPVRSGREKGTFRLGSSTPIRYGEGLSGEAALLADALDAVLDARPPVRPAGEDAGGPAVQLRRGEVGAPGRPATKPEAYRLTVDTEEGVTVVGADAAGVFYGVQTLRGLLPPRARRTSGDTVSVPGLRITDRPRFPYRGLHLDVARHFQEPADVKRLLDVMALYKLNRLHLHLTDDEGWRLAVRGLPELTRVGGRRGHTRSEREHLVPSFGSGPDPDTAASHGSGWYSTAEYRELVRYADRRHVQVVPEVDVPGHARAAIKAMEARYRRLESAGRPGAATRYRLVHPRDTSRYESVQGWDDNVVDVCRPSTYRFLARVVDELVRLHEEAGAPLTAIHLGGDEVPEGAWVGSPACQRLIQQNEAVRGADDLPGYFQRRVRDSLATRGLTLAGWGAIPSEPTGEAPGGRAYLWRNLWGSGGVERGYRLANQGQEVVLAQASSLYFDMAYSAHPRERGNYWAGFVGTPEPHGLVPLDLCRSVRPSRLGTDRGDAARCEQGPELTPEGRRNVLGIQGQLWSEMLAGPDRMEYMAVPRLMSLAERAWSPRPEWADDGDRADRVRRWSVEWTELAHRLDRRELPRLSALDPAWDYRLPPPGAVLAGGLLRANVALPGLAIRYTTDGSPPTEDSRRYTEAVDVSGEGTVNIRTFGPGGRASRTVTVQADAEP